MIPSPRDFASCVVSFSAGKDSVAALGLVLQQWPPERVTAHYQVLPEQATWWDLPYTQPGKVRRTLCPVDAQAVCQQWGVQFVAEQIVYRPVLNPRSTQPETGVQTAQIHAVPDWTHVSASCAPDRIGGLVGLALRRGRPPTRRYRYCTSYYKERTLDHWLRRHRPLLGSPVAVVLGTRAAESPSRQKTPPCRERTNATARTRNAHVYDVHPVLAWSRRDVYRALDHWGVEPHPTYTLLGLDSHQMLAISRYARNGLAVPTELRPRQPGHIAHINKLLSMMQAGHV